MNNYLESVKAWVQENAKRYSSQGLNIEYSENGPENGNSSCCVIADNNHLRSTITTWGSGQSEIIAVSASTGESVFIEEEELESLPHLQSQLQTWVEKIANYKRIET